MVGWCSALVPPPPVHVRVVQLVSLARSINYTTINVCDPHSGQQRQKGPLAKGLEISRIE